MYKSKRLFKNQLLSSTFVKNVVTLSFGSIISQGINFLFLPLLSRLYGPSEFGLFYSFVGITQTITIFSTLKYEKSIILPKDDDEGNGLLFLTLIIAFTYSIFVAIILIILKLMNLNFGEVGKYFFLIPFSVLSYAFLSAISLWYQREERFKLISLISIFQALLIVLISSLLGIFKFRQNGLAFGYVFGCVILVLILVAFNYNSFYLLFKNWKKTSFLKNFKKYINFPKYYLPYDLLSTGSLAIIPVIIASNYSKIDCGLFSMAFRILNIPFIVISSSVSNVFMVNAIKIFNKNMNFNSLFVKTFNRIFLIGIIIFITAFSMGGLIITLLLGDKWIGIDVFIKILSVMLFFEFLTTVFKSNTYIIVEKQKTGMYIQLVSTIINLSSLLFLSGYGIQTALIVFASTSSIFSCLNLYITYKFSFYSKH